MNKQVWFITGSSRGLGAAIAQAALAAGHQVVATGRNVESVEDALGGPQDNLLALRLDVTNEADAQEAVAASLRKFGRIDVLVNNAGYGLLGAVEEASIQEVEALFNTNVFGLLGVTRAVLPVMRDQQSGHILNLSSIGGFQSFSGLGAYCATKFAVEGLSEALALEVAPFGIKVTIVEPGYFRTDFLADNSIRFSEQKLEAYADTVGKQREMFHSHNGQQAGDPAKLAQALLNVTQSKEPPMRLPMGTDAVGMIDTKLTSLKAELEQWRELATSTDYEPALVTA